MREKRKKELTVNNNKVRIGWEELLYDLIFIIVISKVSSMLVEYPYDMNIGYFLGEIILFIFMLSTWFKRVIDVNRIHTLSKELKINIPRYKSATYIELTALILIFYQVDKTVNGKFYLAIIFVTLICTWISMLALRNYLINYYSSNNERFIENFRSVHIQSFFEINVPHVLERFGILMILFLSEILSEMFSYDFNIITLFLSIIILFEIFNDNIKIVETLEKKYKEKTVVKLGSLKSIFYPMLLFLLAIIVVIDYEKQNMISLSLLLIGVLIANKIYQRFTLYRLYDVHFKIYDWISLVYFTLLVVIIYYFKLTNTILIIFILLLPIIDKFCNKHNHDI